MDDARKLSLKDKIRHFFCLACCFTAGRRETLRSSQSVDLPEIKRKCYSLFTRIGNANGGPNHRRRRSSADFSYDPLSYALNFEEDACEDDDPVMGFASRLPPTPKPPPAASAAGV